MLMRFLYLDNNALDGYLSSVEDGLRTTVESEDRSEGSKEGKVDVRFAGASGAQRRTTGAKITSSDTAQARYRRLIEAIELDPEQYDWHDILDIDNQLEQVHIGSLIQIECEIHVPDIVRVLSSGELSGALDLFQGLLPMAKMYNFDTQDVPDEQQLASMTSLAKILPNDHLVVVGEPDSDEWKVTGKLRKEYLSDSDVDGFANVVGKVTAKWKRGEWRNLLTLPGLNLMPRAQRRKMEKEGPSKDNADSFLEGPALMLDILAIYR